MWLPISSTTAENIENLVMRFPPKTLAPSQFLRSVKVPKRRTRAPRARDKADLAGLARRYEQRFPRPSKVARSDLRVPRHVHRQRSLDDALRPRLVRIEEIEVVGARRWELNGHVQRLRGVGRARKPLGIVDRGTGCAFHRSLAAASVAVRRNSSLDIDSIFEALDVTP